MNFEIPQPVKAEHEALHAELAKAVRAGGETGDAARTVADLLHPHFAREEEFAMPPLGLLSRLAAGTVTPEMAAVLSMTDRLKADLPQMLDEHRRIVGALERLAEIARREKRPEYADFAEKLVLHAQAEEEVLYPAAILIGEYVKLRLGTQTG